MVDNTMCVTMSWGGPLEFALESTPDFSFRQLNPSIILVYQILATTGAGPYIIMVLGVHFLSLGVLGPIERDLTCAQRCLEPQRPYPRTLET